MTEQTFHTDALERQDGSRAQRLFFDVKQGRDLARTLRLDAYGSRAREIWIDAAKGIGIILVVVAHALILDNQLDMLERFIYLFHMPLFFMLAGYLQSGKPVGEYNRNRAISLLVPYLAFLAVLSLPLAARSALAYDQGQVLPIDEFFANLWGGKHLTGIHGTFWFITCLLVAQVIFNVMLTRWAVVSTPMIICVIGLGTLGYLLAAVGSDLPGNAGVAPMAIVFLWFGAFFRAIGLAPSSLFVWFGLSIVVLLLLVVSTGWAPSFDMKPENYGVPIISIIIAVGLSCGVFAIVQLISQFDLPSRVLAYFGSASLTIMYLHLAAFRVTGQFSDNTVLTIAVGLLLPLAVHQAIGLSRTTRFLFSGSTGEHKRRPDPVKKSREADVVRGQFPEPIEQYADWEPVTRRKAS
ncbi:MAG TPA: hypothetical protein DCL54_04745 [Alphaproteobacteria bacterium]|nr:hypothetical protein [Alphaproteobacteria bacterium]HAJ45873.1 hypothetical protein [Alphaproteobacteria bacterium]